MTTPTGSSGTSTQETPTEEPDRWSQRHPRLHGAVGVIVAAVIGFLVWWAAADAFTTEGRNMWRGPGWSWGVAVLLVGGAGMVGGVSTWFMRRARCSADEDVQNLTVPWSERHPQLHGAAGVFVGAVTGFFVWWALAEAFTADGRNVWWEPWSCIGTGLVVVGAGTAGYFSARFARQRSIDRRSSDDDGEMSLLWLVIVGIFGAVALGAGAAYWQAELLTAPGESVAAIESRELLDIARATTFGLGALGAVAVLIVNYRKQKSTEIALKQDQTKHNETLAQAQNDLEHEREKHQKQMELERAKQRASEIAALHERFTKAVGQLSDVKPAIRLGGVHAIAGVAADWKAKGEHTHHQSCIDLLCAYLRSDPPSEPRVPGTRVTGSSKVELSAVKKDQAARRAALEALSRIKKPPKGSTFQEAIRSLTKLDGLNRQQEVVIDLRGTDLRGLDLRKARLVGLPLNEVNLAGADLARADLTGARMIGATVTGADFAGATLLNVRPDAAALRSFGALNIPEVPAEQLVAQGDTQANEDVAKAE